MQSRQMVQYVDTPYKNTSIDRSQNQFLESFLTSQPNEIFNHQGFEFDGLFRNDDDCHFPHRRLYMPLQQFDFGTYFEAPALKPHEICKLFEEDRSSLSDDTALQSSETQTPCKYEHQDVISTSGTSVKNSEVHDAEFHKIEASTKCFNNIQYVPKVNRQSKKISKKTKGKKKGKKSKRMSERLKNIVKNYGKNCATFAISELGIPFLSNQLSVEEIAGFKEYIRSKIAGITNIANFREMLLSTEKDSEDIVKYKKTFQYISEIFIRDYSFNWIFHSPRINDVKGHIFARFKMLRRIRDPEHFTYIH